MSKKVQMVAVILLLSTASAIAQVAMPAEPRTVRQVLDFWVTNTEQLLVPAADAMPEAKYSFAPSNGEFSGVRTFAEQVKHLAAANYQLAAATLGEEPPAGTDHETAPEPVSFLTISGFTNDQCIPENLAPAGEFLSHSVEILGKVPIRGKSWLSKADRSSSHRCKRSVIAWRSDFDHLIVLQEHKSEKLFC